MNHLKILKESYSLVLKHKYLWFLGLFLGGGIGSNFLTYTNNNNSGGIKRDSSGNIASLVSANVKDVGQVLGDKISAGMSNVEWVIAAIFILLLIVILIYLYITARGATTWAIAKIHSGVKFGLGDAWKMGRKCFWRRLSFDIITGASVLVIMSILATPVILLAIFELVVPAIVLGILFGLAFFAFVFYLSLFLPYSERILFLENKKTFPALLEGFRLFNKNWVNLLLMYLIIFAIGIAVGIGLAFAILICGLLAFGIGAAFYIVSHIAGYVIGGLIGFAMFLALIIFCGALQSFNWAVITLAYKEVK